jgi:hypothetical protein
MTQVTGSDWVSERVTTIGSIPIKTHIHPLGEKNFQLRLNKFLLFEV